MTPPTSSRTTPSGTPGTPGTRRPETPRRRSSRPAPTQRPPRSRTPLVALAAVVAVVLAALVVAVVAAGDGADDARPDGSAAATASESDATGALPRLTGADDDPAVGRRLPTLAGTDVDGRPMTVAADGTPKILVFVAHWCPHCQREVPVIQDWVDSGGLPDGVELAAVATAIDPRRPNHPPEDWLAREGWTAPVLYDGDSSAAAAVGLSAYPFFVAVDGDGTVVQRNTGELTANQLDAVAQQLAG